MNSAPDPQWDGTPQHPTALDLSRFLIHLTRSEADLASIITRGVIEARGAYGVVRAHSRHVGRQESVCFTEMPMSELNRMVSRGRSYGVVFSKERLRVDRGAQAVWYLSDPSPEYSAVLELMTGSQSRDDPIWRIAPFIEGVRDTASDRPNDWRWEREWRVIGNLTFELDEIAAILIPTPTGDLERSTDIALGVPYITSDGDFFWTGGTLEATDAGMELLVARFYEHWTSVDNALLPLDHESPSGYAEMIPIHDVDDAVLTEFEDFPGQVREALADALQNESLLWCRISDAEGSRA